MSAEKEKKKNNKQTFNENNWNVFHVTSFKNLWWKVYFPPKKAGACVLSLLIYENLTGRLINSDMEGVHFLFNLNVGVDVVASKNGHWNRYLKAACVLSLLFI